MTFAIAAVLTDDDGRISVLADTKLTDAIDATRTRHIYTHPVLKTVIVDDDIAVSFAGDNPQSALRFVTRLRGRSAAEVVEALRQYSAHLAISDVSKSFLIAKRAPGPKLWRIVRGEVDDSTQLPRLWIGDRAAFRAFQAQYQSTEVDRPIEYRMLLSMQAIVAFNDFATVGGYITRVTGDALRPFRFQADQANMGPWMTEGVISGHDGHRTLAIGVPAGFDPSGHQKIAVPGGGDTYAALAFVIPEANTAWMWTHSQPWRSPVKLSGLRTMSELVRTAKQQHGQLLSPAWPDG